MDALIRLEAVPLQVLVVSLLLVLAPLAALALVVVARVGADNRAAAVARARRSRRMPRNLATRMWDFDERGRPW